MNSAIFRVLVRRLAPRFGQFARDHSRIPTKNVPQRLSDIFGRGLISSSTWPHIRDTLVHSRCNEENVDNFVVDFCRKGEFSLENSVAYVEFLYASSIPVNLEVKLQVIRLFRKQSYANQPTEEMSDKIAGL